MKYFENDFLKFFSELEENNNKEWFDANRKRYEKSVKKPFKKFIQDLAAAIQPLYPEQDLSDKFSIMRINRDIRFSADKTPYKIHMAAMILPYDKKDKTKPGLYVQTNHDDIRVYSGAHMLEKDQLQRVREHIAANLDEFQKLKNDKTFKSTFGEIRGEKNKRLPTEFKGLDDKEPLIANKHFYYFFKLKPNTIFKEDIIDQLVQNYRSAMPVNLFFAEALK